MTEDWPAFLGPHGKPVSTRPLLLQQFGEPGPALVWELAKGTATGSPIHPGDYLGYLHRSGSEVVVECMPSRDRREYWDFDPNGF